MEQKELSKPTPEQVKKFWEYFGIKQGSRIPISDNPNAEVYNWYFPDGLTTMKPPKLDLKDLFKYAVPRLQEEELQSITFSWRRNGECEAILWFYSGIKVDGLGMKEEDALFWAVWEVIKKEKDEPGGK